MLLLLLQSDLLTITFLLIKNEMSVMSCEETGKILCVKNSVPSWKVGVNICNLHAQDQGE